MKRAILFYLICCTFMVFSAEKPLWINNVSKVCKSSQLCAVGEGPNRNIANRNAVLELSKIFDNKISSQFSSSLSVDSKTGSEENMQDEIKQITESAFQGVQVDSYFEEGSKVYALAIIVKSKMAASLKSEMDRLDDKMKVLADDNRSASSQIELERVYLQRQLISQRHEFLTGLKLDPPVSYEKIFKNKKDALKNVVVHVSVKEDGQKKLEQLLANEITGLGYRTTRGTLRNVNATHIVSGEFVAEKQSMQVEGFEKYSFALKISAVNSKKIGTGEFLIEATTTGRNYSQAYEKAMSIIKEQIKEKMVELKLE